MCDIIYSDASISHLDPIIRLIILRDQGNGRYYQTAKSKTFPSEISITKLEFLGVFYALKLADNNSIIYTDNQAVVESLKDNKSTWLPKQLLKETINLMKQKNCKILWINRERNLAGLGLEKRLKKSTSNQIFKRNVKKFGINHASYKIKRKVYK